MGPNQNFVTLDPAAKKPVFSVYAINYARLDVRINAVQPSDWPAYQQYLRDYQRTDIQVKLPGRQVLSKTINVESAADTLSEVNIDLTQVMDGPYGHFIVMVQPPSDLLKDPQNRYWQTVQAWVQVTQIGLDAFTDHSRHGSLGERIEGWCTFGRHFCFRRTVWTDLHDRSRRHHPICHTGWYRLPGRHPGRGSGFAASLELFLRR